MAILANDIIARAQVIVQDTTGVRWPEAELLRWLNDGQREVAIVKPSATAQNVALTLQAGTLQHIGTGGLQLIRVVRNLKNTAMPRVGTRATRVVDREVLDAQHPSWHDPDVFPYTKEVKHFCFDEVDPTHFYVFPGNDGTGVVEAIISQSPPDATLGGNINVPDIYSNALLDYVLFRAYQKDADYAGNAERSAIHYQLMLASLTAKGAAEGAVSPNAGPAR